MAAEHGLNEVLSGAAVRVAVRRAGVSRLRSAERPGAFDESLGTGDGRYARPGSAVVAAERGVRGVRG